MTHSDGNGGSGPIRVIPLPRQGSAFRDLGTTALAKLLGLQDWQLNGHWCSRCAGIWYGYTLETECPCCGNRRG